MKVLVLGGSGFIGRRIVESLAGSGWAEPVSASRHVGPVARGATGLRLDSLDRPGLEAALRDAGAVVNCVLGDGRSIAQGARTLVAAAAATGCQRIVHLSTMSVYGSVEGSVTESSPLRSDIGWYGAAKCEAERLVRGFAERGDGSVVILRPGCVYGPDGDQWVGRLCRWVRSGRLGDLGAAGDGWSNLVHVDDVAQAVMESIRGEPANGSSSVFNLAAPDSPRWNDYFVRLAMLIGATPVRRVTQHQFSLDVKLFGLPLKVAERLLSKVGKRPRWLPEGIPPSLAKLWAQEIRLDSRAVSQSLELRWTPYDNGVADAARAWAAMQRKTSRSPKS